MPQTELICAFKSSSGCPIPCNCIERPVDKTVIIDCATKLLLTERTLPDISELSKRGVYKSWRWQVDLSGNLLESLNNSFITGK